MRVLRRAGSPWFRTSRLVSGQSPCSRWWPKEKRTGDKIYRVSSCFFVVLKISGRSELIQHPWYQEQLAFIFTAPVWCVLGSVHPMWTPTWRLFHILAGLWHTADNHVGLFSVSLCLHLCFSTRARFSLNVLMFFGCVCSACLEKDWIHWGFRNTKGKPLYTSDLLYIKKGGETEENTAY